MNAIVEKNKTNHPMSSNSHPSATAKKGVVCRLFHCLDDQKTSRTIFQKQNDADAVLLFYILIHDQTVCLISTRVQLYIYIIMHILYLYAYYFHLTPCYFLDFALNVHHHIIPVAQWLALFVPEANMSGDKNRISKIYKDIHQSRLYSTRREASSGSRTKGVPTNNQRGRGSGPCLQHPLGCSKTSLFRNHTIFVHHYDIWLQGT